MFRNRETSPETLAARRFIDELVTKAREQPISEEIGNFNGRHIGGIDFQPVERRVKRLQKDGATLFRTLRSKASTAVKRPLSQSHR